jgi:hypothetical protein
MKPQIDNIKYWFGQATEEQIQAGLRWFPGAHAAIKEAMPHIPVANAAGGTAALSQGIQWEDNLVQATRMASGQLARIRAYGKWWKPNTACGKAYLIFAGVHPLKILKGPKVIPFFYNLMLDFQMVTVDRHAINAALSREVLPRDLCVLWTKDSKNRHPVIVEMYRAFATWVGLEPAIAQAIIWTVFRERFAKELRIKKTWNDWTKQKETR